VKQVRVFCLTPSCGSLPYVFRDPATEGPVGWGPVGHRHGVESNTHTTGPDTVR